MLEDIYFFSSSLMVRKNKLESLSVTCFSKYFSLFEQEASLNKHARRNYTSLFVKPIRNKEKRFLTFLLSISAINFFVWLEQIS
jgi:hypothetical protein